MTSQLLKLSMLLMSLTYSLSLNQTITVAPEIETSSDKNFQTLSESTQGNKVAALMATSSNEPKTPHASTKESKVTPEQQTSPSSVATQEVTSKFTADVMTIGLTVNKDQPPASNTVRSRSDLINLSTGLPVTNQVDEVTNDRNMPTSSRPSGEKERIPTTLATKTPQNASLPPNNELSKKKKQTIILIVVFIVILILILATTLFIMVRSKRRSGSQNFNRRSRSSNKQDVWAGQVPELGDGKMTQHPMGMENGKAGNKEEAGKEQEMVTFVSGEKKDDSVVELNEMGKGDAMEEKKPLLEDGPHENDDPEKLCMEQTPTLTMEKDQV